MIKAGLLWSQRYLIILELQAGWRLLRESIFLLLSEVSFTDPSLIAQLVNQPSLLHPMQLSDHPTQLAYTILSLAFIAEQRSNVWT